jgi:hypothetical protein
MEFGITILGGRGWILAASILAQTCGVEDLLILKIAFLFLYLLRYIWNL